MLHIQHVFHFDREEEDDQLSVNTIRISASGLNLRKQVMLLAELKDKDN